MPRVVGPVLVVGYDGSPASRCAVAIAARRAGRDGKLYVVHAYEEGPDLTGALDWVGEQHRRRARAEATLDGLLLIAAEELLQTRFEARLAIGPPASTITALARELDADEIVLGARGLGRVRALLGSVSHDVLHLADRPVLVIPLNAVSTVEGWSSAGGVRPLTTPAVSAAPESG